MAELLSREKELLKLNNQLNQMTTDTLKDNTTQAAYPNQMVGGIGLSKLTTYGGGVQDAQFMTYIKQKGTSTLVRKSGAGDALSEQKERSDRTFTRSTGNQNTKSLKAHLKGNIGQQTKTINANQTEWQVTRSLARTAITQSTAAGTSLAVAGVTRKDDVKTNSMGGSHNIRTTTFVRYRNPNFKESSSLHQLLQDENAQQLQQQQQQQQDNVDLAQPSSTQCMTSIINGSNKKVSTDNYIKYLKSQIGIYEEDHQHIKQEMCKQKELLERTIDNQRQLEAQRDQAVSMTNQLSEKLRSMEMQLEEHNRRNKEQQQEKTNQHKEFENMKRELRVFKQNNANLENRLTRATEELEQARKANSSLKLQEREQRESMRQELETKEKQIKALKRQRIDLLNAYKKQLFMIDNLKRQNSCMEQSAIRGFGEKEFNKVLEWNAPT